MNILIGSKAIKVHFPDFPREPGDVDFATDEYIFPTGKTENGQRWEYYPIPPILEANRFSSSSLATRNQLYTLKVSHAFWNIHWDKTMFDIVWLQKNGCELDMKLFWKLYRHWTAQHGVMPRANLDMPVDEFFDNGIMDGHAHDGYHFKIKNPPTYTKILIDPKGVAVSEDGFFELSHEDKLEIVREECYVMAYERGVRQGTKDYRDAYRDQLKAWILHHGPTVRMALWAIQNFDELRKPVINYKEVIEHD